MFEFPDLDEATRKLALEEIDQALNSDNLYFSKRFNQRGNDRWPPLLREALTQHNEHWLAYQIEAEGLMKDFEGARTPSGGYTVRHVSSDAALTLAEGQFNRFYMAGVCRRAIEAGQPEVVVYRAMERETHRPESDALVGQHLNAEELLKHLRSKDLSLKHALLRPNSGLSVRWT